MLAEVLNRPQQHSRDYLADRYADMACLLNGKPAKIMRGQTGAVIVEFGGWNEAAFDWDVVHEVMTRLGGRFRA